MLHFAAKSLVGESVAQPGMYWSHNLGGSLALLEAMRAAGVASIVFSSTAAVYGEPESVPVEETAAPRPTNPYGASKVAVDTALAEYARMHGFGAVSLRYFNVAGAFHDRDAAWLGERHTVETHLIPNILKIARDHSGPVSVFGDDYPTPDGTCIRDYVHVADLAAAHLLALAGCRPAEHQIFNLGGGRGYSNLEVLSACREVTGLEIPAKVTGRRAGDPAVLIASSERIGRELGWRPERGLHEDGRGRLGLRLPVARSAAARGQVDAHLEQLRLDPRQFVLRPVASVARRRLAGRYQDRDGLGAASAHCRSGSGHARRRSAARVERDRDVLLTLDQARRADAELAQVGRDAGVVAEEADLLRGPGAGALWPGSAAGRQQHDRDQRDDRRPAGPRRTPVSSQPTASATGIAASA